MAAAVAALALTLSYAAPAHAQLNRIGTNPVLVATPVRGTDVAYDPGHGVYLVVGAHGSVWGIFTDTAGNALSSFTINTTGGFAQFPRVTYGSATGGFVVTWHENSGTTNFVNTRVVAYPGGPVSAQQTISAPVGTWWESGASIAYSATSQLYLVVWRSANYQIWAARLAANGSLIGSAFQISPTSDGARDPNVAWNAATNEFGVLYTGWAGTSTQTSFSLVSAGGSVLGTNVFSHGGAAGTYITDLAYNSATNRYVGVWWQASAGTLGAEIAADGSVLAVGPVSTTTGTYDGMGLAYNPGSGTFLLVGHGPSFDVWSAELNSHGARTSGDAAITSAGGPTGSFYPRTTARSDAVHWNISFAHNFNAIRDQVVWTSSTGGGPSGSLGAAPPTQTGGGGGTTTTGSCPGTAPFPGAVCVNGGWVPGTTSGGGGTTSTGGCPGTAPFPGAVCVNGGWVAGTTGSGGGTTSTGSCPGSAPFPGAVCVNGGWVPGGSTSGGTTSTGGCAGTAPFAGAVCVNGGWVPGGSTSGGTTSTGSCPGSAPFPGAVCVNGGWVPGGSTSGGTTSTGGCAGTAPFPGAVCVNGGWVPGGSTSGGTTSTGSCPGSAPFPGAVCVNGGWVPGGTSGTTSTGSCAGSAPFPGAVCVNGGWVPGTGSSCPGTAPFPGAVCVNGGWVPGTTTSSCPGSAPFPGAVCVNGGWVPGTTSGSTSSCTTPDPFTAIGGGICSNGGWTPRG